MSPLHGCLSKHFKWKCTWHFRRRCNHQTLECSWHHSEWAGFLLPRSRLLFQLIEKPTEDNTRKFIEHRCCVFLKIGHIVLNMCVSERLRERGVCVPNQICAYCRCGKTFISLYFKSQTDCDDAKLFHHEMHSHLQSKPTKPAGNTDVK